jgi:hypothetical protein
MYIKCGKPKNKKLKIRILLNLAYINVSMEGKGKLHMDKYMDILNDTVPVVCLITSGFRL